MGAKSVVFRWVFDGKLTVQQHPFKEAPWWKGAADALEEVAKNQSVHLNRRSGVYGQSAIWDVTSDKAIIRRRLETITRITLQRWQELDLDFLKFDSPSHLSDEAFAKPVNLDNLIMELEDHLNTGKCTSWQAFQVLADVVRRQL